MKATGIVRAVDSLGRIVLPIELRRVMSIDTKDAVEIFVEDDYILLKKYEPSCVFCGGMKGIAHYNGKNVCSECIEKLSNLKR